MPGKTSKTSSPEPGMTAGDLGSWTVSFVRCIMLVLWLAWSPDWPHWLIGLVVLIRICDYYTDMLHRCRFAVGQLFVTLISGLALIGFRPRWVRISITLCAPQPTGSHRKSIPTAGKRQSKETHIKSRSGTAKTEAERDARIPSSESFSSKSESKSAGNPAQSAYIGERSTILCQNGTDRRRSWLARETRKLSTERSDSHNSAKLDEH